MGVMPADLPASSPTPRGGRSNAWKGFLRWLRDYPLVAIAALALLSLLFLAVAGPLVAPHSPTEVNADHRFQPPSAQYLLGTDGFGRDVLSRIIYGTRFSLAVGTVAVFIASAAGVFIGVGSGYAGGRVDTMVMAAMDILLCFPIILEAIMLVAFFGQSTRNLMIAIGVSLIPRFARIARAATLAVRSLNYIEAAKALGISSLAICWRHVLPNILSPLVVAVTLNIGVAILMESSLSYLGVGAPPDVVTWGNVTSDGRQALREAPWVSSFGGLAIMLTVLGFNLVGDWIRDRFDPNFRDRGGA